MARPAKAPLTSLQTPEAALAAPNLCHFPSSKILCLFMERSVAEVQVRSRKRRRRRQHRWREQLLPRLQQPPRPGAETWDEGNERALNSFQPVRLLFARLQSVIPSVVFRKHGDGVAVENHWIDDFREACSDVLKCSNDHDDYFVKGLSTEIGA